MNQTDKMISVLSDDQSRKTINLLSKTELTIRQISYLLKIPQSTAYRKIKKLEDLEMIKKTKVVRTVEGLDESYYKNWTAQIDIVFKNGELSYKLKHCRMEDKIVRLWQKFSEK